MTSKYLVKFYLRTLLIGVIITTIASLIIDYQEVTSLLVSGEVAAFFINLVWILGYGLLITTISQFAFFIYLFLNPLGMGLLGRVWPYLQLLLIIYAIFDLFYVRYLTVGDDLNWVTYMWVPIFVVVAGVVISRIKDKQTIEKNVFIPALFFMIFMTSITLIPFSAESTEWLYRSIFTLVVTNAYQLLSLPNYVEASKADKARRGVETKADRKERQRLQEQQTLEAKRLKEESQKKTRNKMFKNKVR